MSFKKKKVMEIIFFIISLVSVIQVLDIYINNKTILTITSLSIFF